MREINILILEDTLELEEEPRYIRKIREYIEKCKKKVLDLKVKIRSITTTEQFTEFKNNMQSEETFDIAILDYSLTLFNVNEDENGWVYIKDIMKKNQYCNIILVTGITTIEKEVEKLDEDIKKLISERPNIKYIPKSVDFQSQMVNYVEDLVNIIHSRRKLQDDIIGCAIDSYDEFMISIIENLIKKPDKTIPGKEDTMKLDTITEEHIRRIFGPQIHDHKIVVCTEEGGVENKLIYRIDRPIFYIFSDPLDGSTALKNWINNLIYQYCIEEKTIKTLEKKDFPPEKLDLLSKCFMDKVHSIIELHRDLEKVKFTREEIEEVANYSRREDLKLGSLGKEELKKIISNNSFKELWKKYYGPEELNSPVISIVLTERHQVVGSVLINLFTGDLYFSNDEGNFKSTVGRYDKVDPSSRNKLEFRKKINRKVKEIGKEEKELLLCTLQHGKYYEYIKEKKGKPQDFSFLLHFRECIQPLIPLKYDLEKSFEKREQRKDFTPGPGRILFLTDVAENYSTNIADNNEKELYGCILSSGEPLTEWAGWFAFLRHEPHISAYCLRTGIGNICRHQIQRDNIKGTMMPVEVSSLFKNGIMDFEVLHTGYRDAMHNYTDSLVLFFEADYEDDWKGIIEREFHEHMPANHMPGAYMKILPGYIRKKPE